MIISLWLTLAVLVFEVLILCFMIFIFLSGLHSVVAGAPFVPMKKSAISRLLSFGGLVPNDVFYDLGCGDGRILRSAAKDFHVNRARGYEIAHWPYFLCRYKNYRNKAKNIDVLCQSSFDADIKDATFIYLYLFPPLVDKLAYKIEKEVKIGTKVLSPGFSIDTGKHPRFKLKKEEKFDTMTTYLYEII